MTVEELIQRLESKGWRQSDEANNCRRLKDDSQSKTITISGQLETVVPVGVLRSLCRYAELDEEI